LRTHTSFTYNPAVLASLRRDGSLARRWRRRAPGVVTAAASSLRWARLALLMGALAGVALGCKDEAGVAAPDAAALRAQQGLIARRNALLETRKRTQEERERLQAALAQAIKDGSDTSELQRKVDELDSQLEVQNDQLASEFQALSSKLDSLASDQRSLLAEREAQVARREAEVARREAKLAERDARAAEREREAARACAAPAPTMIVQSSGKVESHSRREIDAALRRARDTMGKRGLLLSDLPPYAQGLEREATRAMTEGDSGKAFLAATQLAATVDDLKVNKEFVRAKIGRLQGLIRAKGTKLDDATNKSMGAGMGEVMQRWGDGDFVRANDKLNQLYGALR
jgi:hypothetical protein